MGRDVETDSLGTVDRVQGCVAELDKRRRENVSTVLAVHVASEVLVGDLVDVGVPEVVGDKRIDRDVFPREKDIEGDKISVGVAVGCEEFDMEWDLDKVHN